MTPSSNSPLQVKTQLELQTSNQILCGLLPSALPTSYLLIPVKPSSASLVLGGCFEKDLTAENFIQDVGVILDSGRTFSQHIESLNL